MNTEKYQITREGNKAFEGFQKAGAYSLAIKVPKEPEYLVTRQQKQGSLP